MKVLVTGATGFIGGNLVRKLTKQGYKVRVLVRPESNTRNIDNLPVERAYGDLRDMGSLLAALRDCEGLFHVAAAYTFWTAKPQDIYQTNVTGTENILSAARQMGVKKIVYTSSECTLKSCDPNGSGQEFELADPANLPGHYKKSKCLAEKIALQSCNEGLPLAIVNPTMPIGAYDVKPTPTGQMIVDFINRRMPACVNAGLNVIDVEDVAEGHILAMEKGRTGQRYVLGNRNLTLREIFLILEQITGLKAPHFNIPLWPALSFAYADEFISGRLLKKQPRVAVASVKAAGKIRHFDCTSAVEELGLPQTPVELAFEKAALWFKENGYAH